jgi:hypothetical protein
LHRFFQSYQPAGLAISLTEFENDELKIPEKGVVCFLQLVPVKLGLFEATYSCSGHAAKILRFETTNNVVACSSALDHFTRQQFKIDSCELNGSGVLNCVLSNKDMAR